MRILVLGLLIGLFAGVIIGLMMNRVMGLDERADESAQYLGKAMQFINFIITEQLVTT